MIADPTCVRAPIFLVGLHGSGTTLTYDTIGRHPDVGFFNHYNKRFPATPRLAWFLTRVFRYDRPLETQRIWDRFRKPETDTLAPADASEAVIAHYRGLVERVLRIRGAQRFVAKYPRLSLRVPWLDRIFPDAVFVHVTRDWRSTVASMVTRKERREARDGGWFGIYTDDWRELQKLPHDIAATRQLLAGTHALEEAAARLGSRFVNVAYEDLCADPVATMRSLCSAVDLPWTAEFEASIPQDLRSANGKWRKGIGEVRMQTLEAEGPKVLKRLERD